MLQTKAYGQDANALAAGLLATVSGEDWPTWEAAGRQATASHHGGEAETRVPETRQAEQGQPSCRMDTRTTNGQLQTTFNYLTV